MGMRDDYQGQTEKRLNEWKAQAEQLKAGAGRMEAQVKTQYETGLALLQAKQGEAWKSFYKLKSLGDDAWEQFTVTMDKASGDLKDAAERMVTQFKK